MGKQHPREINAFWYGVIFKHPSSDRDMAGGKDIFCHVEARNLGDAKAIANSYGIKGYTADEPRLIESEWMYLFFDDISKVATRKRGYG